MRKIFLIDGRSGAGKSTLAQHYAQLHNAQIVSLDEMYPGWDGLAQGSVGVASALHSGKYRVWDWAEQRYDRIIGLTQASLIFEGCGAITATNIEAARRSGNVHAVWVECEELERERRVNQRENVSISTWWDRWARQEDEHISTHNPVRLADEVVVSTPNIK